MRETNHLLRRSHGRQALHGTSLRLHEDEPARATLNSPDAATKLQSLEPVAG